MERKPDQIGLLPAAALGALMLFLFTASAASAIMRPRYAADPLVGWGFLAGVPWLSWTVYRLRLSQ